MTTPHHARPDAFDPDKERFDSRNLVETLTGTLAVLSDWVEAHPGVAARLGAAAGDLVGGYRAAVARHATPGY
jgi:hypothetical protein